MKLLDSIGAKYQSFTTNEKRIFNLMSADAKEFSLQSIGDIARKLEISKTTLMRFAKSCGFDGYTEFKKALQKEVLLDTSPARKMDRVLSGNFDINLTNLFDQEFKNIESTFAGLDEKKLSTTLKLITETEDIYTLSWGISGALADVFSYRLRLMGIRCNAIKRNHGTLLEECSLVRGGDLIIFFDMPPYNIEMVEAVKSLKERGCRIIGITDSPRCPIAELSDISFFCSTETLLFGNSFTGPIFLINILSSLLMYAQKDKVMDSLNEHQRYLDDDRYFHLPSQKNK